METVKILGRQMTDFGTNNYSYGMHLVYFYGKDELDVYNIVQAIKDCDVHCLYLNPSAPCTKWEFYGVMGTPEQYKEFYERQKGGVIATRLMEHFGGFEKFYNVDPIEMEAAKAEIEANYKDWWIE